MFRLSVTVPNLCPQPKSLLINRLINDRLLSVELLTNRHSDVASTHQYMAQNFNKPASVALLRFCNLRTKVWNVRKSLYKERNTLGAIIKVRRLDKAAQWLSVQRCAGPLYV